MIINPKAITLFIAENMDTGEYRLVEKVGKNNIKLKDEECLEDSLDSADMLDQIFNIKVMYGKDCRIAICCSEHDMNPVLHFEVTNFKKR